MEGAVCQQSLCLLLEERERQKCQALRINCRMCGCCFKTQFGQIYEWMDKFGKCDCCTYQKRRNVTKVGRRSEIRFCCPQGRRIFLHKSLLSVLNKGYKLRCDAFPTREKLNTPTDNKQLLRLKRISKSTHSNPLPRDLTL